MKKIVVIITSSLLPIIVIFISVLAAILIVLDFFGTSSTDGYVENNMAYAEDYKKVLNENINNGYVSLERILYFYLARDDYSFSKIYNDNLDYDTKRMKPISEICLEEDYKNISGCNTFEMKYGKQINEYQAKPFGKPIDFSEVSVTSFFMEQRIVFGSYDIHKAWDFAAPAETEVLSVCDGTIKDISFPYQKNETDTAGGYGNNIVLNCKLDDENYNVIYAHLYPNSTELKIGDEVYKGQVIASVGTTGHSTGNHLHYQVQKESGTNVDGMSLIEFSDVELEHEPSDTPDSKYDHLPDKPYYGN